MKRFIIGDIHGCHPELLDLLDKAGHRDYSGTKQPLIYRDRVYGLDTRCCYGGWLTGLLLPDFKLISVASRGDHM
jgi:hypothetical protein